MVRGGQPVERRPERRLGEDEPDARAAAATRIPAVEPECPNTAGTGEPEQRGRGPLAEAAQVLAEPRRDGPERSALESLHESADHPEAVLEGDPRVSLPPRAGAGQPDVSRRRRAACAVRPGPVVSRLAGRIAWSTRQAERGEHRCRPQVPLDPRHDRGQPDELARRMQVEQLVDEVRRAVDRRKPLGQLAADRRGPDVGRGPDEVVGVELGLALLPAAALVATHGAAVALGDRARRLAIVLGLPHDLVGDERPAARRAAGREHVAERHLEARFATRGRGDALERRVEMADVGRSQDDLGEHPRERARFEGHDPPLTVEPRPGDPAAAPERVGDDVAGTGVRVDQGDDEAWGGAGASRSRTGSARPGSEGPGGGRPVIGRS